MPRLEGGAERAAGVPGGWLNPNLVEHTGALQFAVGHAVERDATGEAEPVFAGHLAGLYGQAQHRLADDLLHRGGDVHVPLLERRLGIARRTAQQLIEPAVCHFAALEKTEAIHVQPERAVRLQVNHVFKNRTGETRLAVRREAHQLVLAGVDAKTAVRRERRVEQTQRVRKVKLAQHLDAVVRASADRRRRPLTDAVHREDGGAIERRRIKRARRVGDVMLGEQDRAVGRQAVELVADGLAQVEFLREPGWQHPQPRRQAGRCDGQKTLEHPRKFDDRFVVKHNRIEIGQADAALLQTKTDSVFGKAFVVFAARKAFLLRGGNDPAIDQQRGGRVVVISGDAEEGAHALRSHEGIHERRQRRAGAEQDERGQRHQHHDQRDQPPFLFPPRKGEAFFKEPPHDRRIFSRSPMPPQRNWRRSRQ